MPPTQEAAPRSRAIIAMVVVVIGIALAAVFAWEYRYNPLIAELLGTNSPRVTPLNAPIATALYACAAGKSIQATYYEGASASSTPGEPPVPTGSVALVLSDGRRLTVPQTISASGVRYANADESFVFWNKGTTAFIEEGSGDAQTQTYQNCVGASTADGEENWHVYASSTMRISLRYPDGYLLKDSYVYNNLGPNVPPISGVKLIIPSTIWRGTNLSGFDSGISVEQLPAGSAFSALAFLQDRGEKERSFVDRDAVYLLASTTDAAAGNRYEEAVYAIQGSNPCTAVRYFIHSTTIGNYTPGTVVPYDRPALMAQFDHIRQTLLIH